MSLDDWWIMWAESVLSLGAFEDNEAIWYQAMCILQRERAPA